MAYRSASARSPHSPARSLPTTTLLRASQQEMGWHGAVRLERACQEAMGTGATDRCCPDSATRADEVAGWFSERTTRAEIPGRSGEDEGALTAKVVSGMAVRSAMS